MTKHPLSIALLALTSTLWGCTPPRTTNAAASTPATTATNPPANVIVCAPGSFMSGNECIPLKELECPQGTTSREGQCVADVQVATSPTVDPVAPVTVAELLGEDPKAYADVVDPRQSRKAPRARQLLITEIQGLEALYASVPKDAADRPRLMRRLAEGYVELAYAAARDHKAAKDADTLMKSEKIGRAARTAAIKYYEQLYAQYPKHCQSSTQSAAGKGAGCNDETLYYLGLAYVQQSQLAEARKTFLKLIQSFPQSDFVPHTYFQFGEMFRNEAAGDPTKWMLAEQSYREATKYPGPMRSPSYDRLADVYDAQGKTAEAAAARAKVKSAKVATP